MRRPGYLIAFLMMVVAGCSGGSDGVQSDKDRSVNLKQIALEMYNHHDLHLSFPVRREAKEKPDLRFPLSWRVYCMERGSDKELWGRFALNSPWDSSQNRPLVDQRPDRFAGLANGKGKVSDHTWAELQTLDAGAWFSPLFRGERVPSIDEVFAMIAKHKHAPGPFAVDVKLVGKTVERDLVRLAKKHKVLSRLMFIGRTIESAAMRKRFIAADKNAVVARLAKSPAELKDVISDPIADWVYVRFIPTKAQVTAIHAAGKKVILVGSKVAGNEPGNWKTGVAHGVDAILTDYPLRLRSLVRGR